MVSEWNHSGRFRVCGEHSKCVCGGQRTMFENWFFFPSSIWALRIKLRSPGTFTPELSQCSSLQKCTFALSISVPMLLPLLENHPRVLAHVPWLKPSSISFLSGPPSPPAAMLNTLHVEVRSLGVCFSKVTFQTPVNNYRRLFRGNFLPSVLAS